MTTTITPEPSEAAAPIAYPVRGADHPHANPASAPRALPRAGAQTTDIHSWCDTQPTPDVGAYSPTSQSRDDAQFGVAGGGHQSTDGQLSDDAQKALAVGASSPTSHPPVGSQTTSAGEGSTSRRQVWCAATAAKSEPRREAHDNPEPILRSRPTALTARGADSLTDHADRSAHGRPVGEAHTPPATIIRTIPKAVPSLAAPFSPEPSTQTTPTWFSARGADRLTDQKAFGLHLSNVGEAHTPPATKMAPISTKPASLAAPFSPDAIELATPTVDPRPGLVHPADHLLVDTQKLDVCGVSS